MAYIDRDMAISRINSIRPVNPNKSDYTHGIDVGTAMAKVAINEQPTADVVEVKHGKWTEKEVVHKKEAKNIVEEWQSCSCSICGRYDTRPYMYYFSEPKFCSWCGAEMRKETEDEQLV